MLDTKSKQNHFEENKNKQLIEYLSGISNKNFYTESKTTQSIKLAAEVEKIWILYDIDQNGNLDYEELVQYFNEVAVPCLSLTQTQMHEMFNELDEDNNQNISKMEMEVFLAKLIMCGSQFGLNISSVSDSARYQDAEDVIATQAQQEFNKFTNLKSKS